MMWAFGLVFHLLFLFSKWPIGENGEEEEENSVEFSEEKYYKFVPRNSILPLLLWANHQRAEVVGENGQ